MLSMGNGPHIIPAPLNHPNRNTDDIGIRYAESVRQGKPLCGFGGEAVVDVLESTAPAPVAKFVGRGTAHSVIMSLTTNDPDETILSIPIQYAPPGVTVGNIAPDFVLQALDGHQYSLLPRVRPRSRFDQAVALELAPQGVLSDTQRRCGLGPIATQPIEGCEDVLSFNRLERPDRLL